MRSCNLTPISVKRGTPLYVIFCRKQLKLVVTTNNSLTLSLESDCHTCCSSRFRRKLSYGLLPCAVPRCLSPGGTTVSLQELMLRSFWWTSRTSASLSETARAAERTFHSLFGEPPYYTHTGPLSPPSSPLLPYLGLPFVIARYYLWIRIVRKTGDRGRELEGRE